MSKLMFRRIVDQIIESLSRESIDLPGFPLEVRYNYKITKTIAAGVINDVDTLDALKAVLNDGLGTMYFNIGGGIVEFESNHGSLIEGLPEHYYVDAPNLESKDPRVFFVFALYIIAAAETDI